MVSLSPNETDPVLTTPLRPPYQLGAGIDIAAKTFTAATCLPDAEPTKAENFKQTPTDFACLEKRLRATGFPPDQILVVMEATGNYWIELATYLDQAGFGVSVINPASAHSFAKSLLLKIKNDLLDAQTLARQAITLKPAVWTPPPQIYWELAQRLQQRNDLLATRTRLKNQLHALSVTQAVPKVVERLNRLLEVVNAQLKELEEEIKTVVAQDEKWQHSVLLLQSITGIGPLTAWWLVMLTLNFTLCRRAESLTYFAGLAPIKRQSGTSVHPRPVIGQGGNYQLRALLYMAAASAIRFNPLVKAYFEALIAKGKPYKVARCAAARKLLHLAVGVITSDKAFDAEYGLGLRAKRLAPKGKAS